MPLTDELKKSTRSNTTGECVECGYGDRAGSTVVIRDSKDAAGPTLVVSRQAFAALLGGIRNGDL